MLPNLDVDLLKTFLAIADTGSFTRAAQEVNKTQSAVSMQMKRLEELLGRPIFVRDGRHSRTTLDGDRLIDFARRMVAVNDEAVSAFSKAELTGTLRFGTPDDFSDLFLPEILARFSRTHPMVTVDVECLNSTELFERTKGSELDLALVNFQCNVRTDEPVRREPFVWVTSARHLVHLQERLPIAVSHGGCEWRKVVQTALDAQGRDYRIAYSSPNSSAVNAAVLAGLAVGAMLEFCVRPGMRVLTGKDGFPPLPSFDIGLVRKPGRPSSAAAALASHVTDSIGNLQRPLMAAE